MTTEIKNEELEEEIRIYGKIHENAKRVLSETGFKLKNPEVIKILEGTGKAAYNDETGHIHILYDPAEGIDYTQKCVDLAVEAGKKYKYMPDFNSFAIWGAPFFIEEKNGRRTTTYNDLKKSLKIAVKYRDLIKFWGRPIKVYKGSQFESAKIIEEMVPGIKEIGVEEMADDEVKCIVKEDWFHWICAVQSPLTELEDVMRALTRSAKLGANLILCSMPMSGMSSPQSPEGLLTICHAEILFMIVVAETLSPGIVCIHAGYPCPTKKYQMMHGSPELNFINLALTRLNLLVTGLPTNQAAASTSQPKINARAYTEGRRGRNLFRLFKFHMLGEAFGFVDNLTAFNFEKFERELEEERSARKKFNYRLDSLYIPEDQEALEVIKRRGSTFGYMDDLHTLRNLTAFDDWMKELKLRIDKKISKLIF